VESEKKHRRLCLPVLKSPAVAGRLGKLCKRS
jgi:hypothetical protein